MPNRQLPRRLKHMYYLTVISLIRVRSARNEFILEVVVDKCQITITIINFVWSFIRVSFDRFSSVNRILHARQRSEFNQYGK